MDRDNVSKITLYESDVTEGVLEIWYRLWGGSNAEIKGGEDLPSVGDMLTDAMLGPDDSERLQDVAKAINHYYQYGLGCNEPDLADIDSSLLVDIISKADERRHHTDVLIANTKIMLDSPIFEKMIGLDPTLETKLNDMFTSFVAERFAENQVECDCPAHYAPGGRIYGTCDRCRKAHSYKK